MNLNAIIHRAPPRAWADGDNIPWNEPGFSERMLKEHLSQEHDAASRRFETIDRHIAFIHEQVLGGKPGRVLDLGCGPGFYTMRLARLGHAARGIDFSPASVAYAQRAAAEEGLGCTFELSDIRVANYGTEYETAVSEGTPGGGPVGALIGGYDLIMLLYGEFNVFSPLSIRTILSNAWAALKPGGALLLEPSTPESIRSLGAEPQGWSAKESGLFSDRPHVLLFESGWDEAARAAVSRYYVIEEDRVLTMASTYQLYEEDDLRGLLGEHGFGDITIYPSLLGEGSPPTDFIALVARKQAA